MTTERLDLTATCGFEATRYENFPTDVSLEYVERASDGYYSDHTTSVTISEEDARKIIAFLTAAFGPNVGVQARPEAVACNDGLGRR